MKTTRQQCHDDLQVNQFTLKSIHNHCCVYLLRTLKAKSIKLQNINKLEWILNVAGELSQRACTWGAQAPQRDITTIIVVISCKPLSGIDWPTEIHQVTIAMDSKLTPLNKLHSLYSFKWDWWPTEIDQYSWRNGTKLKTLKSKHIQEQQLQVIVNTKHQDI